MYTAPSAPLGGQVRRPRAGEEIDVTRLMLAARRQGWLPIAGALAGAVMALAVTLMSIERFTAASTILIEGSETAFLGEVSPLPEALRDDLSVRNELEVLRSQRLALSVVDRLALQDDMDFMNPPTALVSQVKDGVKGIIKGALGLVGIGGGGSAGGGAAAGEDLRATPRERAAGLLRLNLTVERINRSNVMTLAYEGRDPQRVTRIVRAYGEAYAAFRASQSLSEADAASDWLLRRLDGLEARSAEAASTLRDFRLENEIVSVRGDLLSNQQLSELASRLVDAQGRTAERKARLDQYEALLDDGSANTILSALAMGGGSDEAMLAEMRRRHQETSIQRRAVVDRWGAEHPEAARLTDQLGDIDAEIVAVLGDAMAAIRADYRIAVDHEAALRQSLSTLVVDSGTLSDEVGQLQRLEAVSETYNELYASFLRQLETLAEQATYPRRGASVLSEAEVPKGASSPNTTLAVAAGLVLGGLFGGGIGALREILPQPLRTAEDARRASGVGCAGLMPAAGDPEPGTLQLAERTLDNAVSLALRRGKRRGAVEDGRALVLMVTALTRREEPGIAARIAERLAATERRVLFIGLGGEGAEWLDKAANWPGAPVHCVALDPADLGPDAMLWRILDGVEGMEVPDCVVVAAPPLVAGPAAEAVAARADTALLAAAWGATGPDLVAEALEAHPALSAALAAMILSDADARAARRYVRPSGFENAVLRQA
ncbi:MAG: Wzz/FepE/Etk N-terminal domain-containing protein [Pseudomonadota bacterium]